MPGLEKQAARYPQFFSRIGFVHEFRALAPAEVQNLPRRELGIASSASLPRPPAADVVAALIASQVDFRLITRLLTQV